MNNINKNDEPMFLTVTMSETVITYLLLNFWLHLLNFSIISLLVESQYKVESTKSNANPQDI